MFPIVIPPFLPRVSSVRTRALIAARGLISPPSVLALLLVFGPLGCATTGPADSAVDRPTDGPEATEEPEDRGGALVIPTVPPRPGTGPVEPAPEVRAGEQVSAIRLDVDPILLQVGESVDFDGLNPTPVDQEGQPVPRVRILVAPLQGRVATFEEGRITGREEGEIQLTLAVLVPGAGGQPEPRLFPKRIVVRGAPVASLEVVPPPLTLYAGTSLPFSVRALTAQGMPRSRVEVTWSSRNPEIASVSDGGLVRGHRPGRAALLAAVEGVEVTHVVEVRENPVRTLDVSPSSGSVRTGDVLRFRALARDGAGQEVTDIALSYSVGGALPPEGMGALVYDDGAFVAERPGDHRVLVVAGSHAAEAGIRARPRGVGERAQAAGTGLLSQQPTSDLEVFRGRDGRDYAYVGSHAGGGKVFVWDVTDPDRLLLTDSVRVEARGVNDVTVAADGSLAVLSGGGPGDLQDALVLLDLERPARPRVLARYREGLSGAVHRTFLEGSFLYAVDSGTADLRILDLSNPAMPREVGRWGIDAEARDLRDFRIRDGIGVAAYGDHGVWILDVGDGRWGGTPTVPTVISSWAMPDGHIQVAAIHRNPHGHRYVFMGDERFGCPDCISRAGPHEEGPRGSVRILSLEDLEAPKEVARFEVPEAGVRNLHLQGDRLYAAYGQGGLRVVDVSGELRGDLYRQGREIAWFPTGHPSGFTPNTPMARGVRFHRGHVFVSDLNSGLWAIRLVPLTAGGVP
jgi:hypothetical protein